MAVDYFGMALDEFSLALVNHSSWFLHVTRMLITEISPRCPLNRKLGRAVLDVLEKRNISADI